jgi:hypothetical protein
MYPCINNTMMNFVCIHPSVESQADTGDEGMSCLWQADCSWKLDTNYLHSWMAANR